MSQQTDFSPVPQEGVHNVMMNEQYVADSNNQCREWESEQASSQPLSQSVSCHYQDDKGNMSNIVDDASWTETENSRSSNQYCTTVSTTLQNSSVSYSDVQRQTSGVTTATPVDPGNDKGRLDSAVPDADNCTDLTRENNHGLASAGSGAQFTTDHSLQSEQDWMSNTATTTKEDDTQITGGNGPQVSAFPHGPSGSEKPNTEAPQKETSIDPHDRDIAEAVSGLLDLAQKEAESQSLTMNIGRLPDWSSSHQHSAAEERHPLLSPCYCLKLKCTEKIPEERRKEIHHIYWSLARPDARERWILNHVITIEHPGLARSRSKRKYRRWQLPDSAGKKVKVCQEFFLRTLGYKCSTAIQLILTRSAAKSQASSSHALKDPEKLLALMHVRSFFSRYYPLSKKSHKVLKQSFEFGLVKIAFLEFRALYPNMRVAYSVFRRMFHQIRVNGGASIRSRRNIQTLTAGSPRMGMTNKVIMHMDIENDAVIITKNVSDSDTETETDKTKSTQALNSVPFGYSVYDEQAPGYAQYTLQGNDERMEHMKKKYPLLEPCVCECQCAERISEARWQEIHSTFWSMNPQEQQDWLKRHGHTFAPQEQQSGLKEEPTSCFLTNEDHEQISVCTEFFQRSLGFSENELGNYLSELRAAGRGKQRGQHSHRMTPQVRLAVKQHISDYLNSTDHMRTSDTSSKKTPSKKKMAVKQLHSDFRDLHPDMEVSYQQYRIIFHDVRNNFAQERGDESRDLAEGTESLPEGNENMTGSVTDSSGVQRRRSTRRTRMQGSMAEDSLLELGGESRMVSSIVSWHESSKRRQATYNSTVHGRPSGSQQPTKVKKRASVVSVPYTGRKRGRKPGSKNKSGSIKQRQASMDGEDGDTEMQDTQEDEDRPKRLKKRFKLKALQKKSRHPLLPPCQCTRRNCLEKIPEERRVEIHDTFWNMASYKERKRWLAQYMERREKTVKTLTLFPQRRNESKKYFLPDKDGNAVEICRLFFIHTLGFKWHSVVDTIAKTKRPKRNPKAGNYVHKRPHRELPEFVINSVKQYIESLRTSAKKSGDKTDASATAESDSMGLETPDKTPNKIYDPTKINEKDILETAQSNKPISEILLSAESEVPEETAPIIDTFDLSKLKAKDLFRDYKFKYRSLKFNLGYQSFRRIFQSVVDPNYAKNLGNETAEHADDYAPQNSDDEDYEVIDTAVYRTFSSKKKASNKKMETVPKTAPKRKSATGRKRGRPRLTEVKTERVSSEDEADNSFDQSENAAATDSQSDAQENSSERNRESDDCILDVGSGYLKRSLSSSFIDATKYPYTFESKYKKRRALSMRNSGVNYPVLPPCKCTKRRCFEKFTEDQRKKINEMFWSLGSYNERKQWILEHIQRENIRRRVVVKKANPRKLESRWYHLPDDDGNAIDVCKDFFLRTLGYKWDSVIDTIGKTTPKGERWAAPDMRGRKPPPHKITEEAVNSMSIYIESVCHTYQPLYQKKLQKPKKGQKKKSSIGSLVTYGLTMKQLFEDYKSKHPNHRFGYESFRKVFHKVHSSIMATLPPMPETTEDPEPPVSDEANSADPGFPPAPDVNVPTELQSQHSQYIPNNSDSFSQMSHFSSPVPPDPPHSSHTHQPPGPPQHQQPSGNVMERRSCLYQYGNQPVDHHPPPQMPPTCGPPPSGPQGQERYAGTDQDQFMKYGHNLYPPPVLGSSPAHFPQMGEPLGYNSNHNPRPDMVESPGGGGQNQFPPYFMPNPEPLRRQVYQMASQYQSILHHIAESSKFLNYSGFAPGEGSFQPGQDKPYPYPNRQEFYRDNFNPYNIPKSSHGYPPEPAGMPNQYPAHSHMPPPPSMSQEAPPMVISPYSDENEHQYMPDHEDPACMMKGQDMSGGFGNPSQGVEHGKKKRKRSSKKTKSDQPKVKKERKIRPKSLRNYGDHYPMLPPCHCKKRKCMENFTEASRQVIHDTYWDLKNYNERKQWMLLHIKREECKRRRVDHLESTRKQESRWYYLPDDDGNLQEVCKDFFLRTLGYKWDSVIDTIRRTTPKGEISSRPDQRGRKPPAHKLSVMVTRSVIQYVKSMQQASHPSSSQSSQSQSTAQASKPAESSDQGNSSTTDANTKTPAVSIPYGLTMKDLHDDYKAKHAGHKIGYESFRRIFKSLAAGEKVLSDEEMLEDDVLNKEANQDSSGMTTDLNEISQL